jgi:hypothetical protein
MSAGAAYFGSRIPRHVGEEMERLAELGFTGVLHTFSENDLRWYRGTMQQLVALSHAAGLEVQIAPWGLGGLFGGEADTMFAARRPEVPQPSGHARVRARLDRRGHRDGGRPHLLRRAALGASRALRHGRGGVGLPV